MACSSSCPTPGLHRTMGECLRSKGVKVAYCNSANNFDYTAQQKQNRDLDAYQHARSEGIQPASTARRDVDKAYALSDSAGKAYEA